MWWIVFCPELYTLLNVCSYWDMVAFKKCFLLKDVCLSSQSTYGGAYNSLGRRNNIFNNDWLIIYGSMFPFFLL